MLELAWTVLGTSRAIEHVNAHKPQAAGLKEETASHE